MELYELEKNPELFLIAIICDLIITIPFIVFMMICLWKIFEKAGQKGWYAIVPVYNTYILVTKIVGKDTTHCVLHFIPLANIYATVITSLALAKSFGKDDLFGIGLILLGIVFYPWLAFSKEIKYVGPGGVPIHPNSSNSLTSNWQKPS